MNAPLGAQRKPAWLFVGAQPSSGSTLLAELLTSVPGFGRLEDRCEGQWLTPELCDGRNRWNRHAPQNLENVRLVWEDAIRTRAREADVIVEKSPPNLCRMERLMDAFSDFPQSLVLLTRHPLALCASWAQRYSPEVVRCNWCPFGDVDIPDAAAYFRLLGQICGERFKMQEDLHERSDICVSYEDLTRDPETVIGMILNACPVSGTRQAGRLPDVEIDDRNRRLFDTLSITSRKWILDGMAPFAPSVEHFGYRDI